MKRILSKIMFQDKHEVDLQFCPTYTMLHWTTVPVLPATLFISSWSVFYIVDEYTLSRLVSGIHIQLFIQILAIKIIPKDSFFYNNRFFDQAFVPGEQTGGGKVS